MYRLLFQTYFNIRQNYRRYARAAALLAAILSAWQGFAWDGDWTSARSMRDVYDDPNSSHSKAGTDPPQKFYTSTPRDFVDEDPEELSDYFHRYRKDYAPYALARVIYNIRCNGQAIPKGYYLVKVGQWGDGSPDTFLNRDDSAAQKPATESQAWESASEAIAKPPPPSVANEKEKQKKEAGYQVFLFKRMGRVIAVVPIHRMESYRPSRKEKIPHRALAWVEMENRHPVFKFYYKHHLYITDFQ